MKRCSNKTIFMMLTRTAVFIFSYLISSSPGAFAAEKELEKIPCIIHVHSSYSGGKYSKTLSAIAEEAASKGIGAVITADKDLMRWEYGIWPLRGSLKVSYSMRSVLSKCAKKYLDEATEAEKSFPGIVVIAGVESAPFYYWKGNLVRGNLEMHQWHKHMMIFGMGEASDYTNLPVVSNPMAGSFSILNLWPLIFFAAAFFLKKIFHAMILALLSIILLYANYPFRSFEFNNFSGDMGEKPYQKLIDYVYSKNGLVFWAHPEATNSETPKRMSGFMALTKRYPESILNTTGYTGFAIFTEGRREAGKPGGYWDQALNEYISGKRAKPVWAVGELDYGENSLKMEQVQNILWVSERSKQGVFDALKKGHFYTTQQETKWGFRLDEFYTASGNNLAICGQEIPRSGPVLIHMRLSSSDQAERKAKVFIIKNGRIDKIFEASTPVELIYKDPDVTASKTYYRVYIENGLNIIATNPVFIK